MCRTLLFSLVVGGLALGLPFVRDHVGGRGGRAAALVEDPGVEHGVLLVSGGTVPFTLYRAEATPLGKHALLLLAPDARAGGPVPFRFLAKAAARAGVSAVYFEPSEAPGEAVARFQHLAGRQGAALGLDADSVLAWVQGEGLQSSLDTACATTHHLAAAAAWLRQDFLNPGALVRHTLDWTLGAGCGAAQGL